MILTLMWLLALDIAPLTVVLIYDPPPPPAFAQNPVSLQGFASGITDLGGLTKGFGEEISVATAWSHFLAEDLFIVSRIRRTYLRFPWYFKGLLTHVFCSALSKSQHSPFDELGRVDGSILMDEKTASSRGTALPSAIFSAQSGFWATCWPAKFLPSWNQTFKTSWRCSISKNRHGNVVVYGCGGWNLKGKITIIRWLLLIDLCRAQQYLQFEGWNPAYISG